MGKLTKLLTYVGLAACLMFSSVGGASAATVHYKDVKETDNFYKAVENLLEQKAISRTLPNFRPHETVSRGQAASIIVKVLGLDISNVKDPGFKDVPPSHQFYPYIAALANKGIVGGYSDGRFGVNDPLRRGQMAKILVDGFQIPLIGIYNANLDKYNDLDRKYYDQSDYGRSYLAFNQPFGQYVYTMDYYGYVSGYADKTFKMNNPLTRSQLALMIEKVQKSVDQYEYFYFKDYDLTSYTQFDDMMSYEQGTQFESEDPSIISVVDVINVSSSGYEKTSQPPDADILLIKTFHDYAILQPHKVGKTKLNLVIYSGMVTIPVEVNVTEENGEFKLSFNKREPVNTSSPHVELTPEQIEEMLERLKDIPDNL
ncbi:hypothetical protein MTP04_04450 [Lysinibacillus sp. PLM2]|nr:hypothetical protein MTP04_04450 [Lysinibacillus sp. PLM2]